MYKNSFNFAKKIEYIKKQIANDDIKKLAELFWIKDNSSLNHRVIHIKNFWLNNNDSFYPRNFKKEYNRYKFSQLIINGKSIFENANEFLNIDYEEFCKRVDEYVNLSLSNSNKSKKEYKYLYLYNKNAPSQTNKVSYYTIEYEKLITPSSFEIKVTAPKYKQEKYNISEYFGKIYFKKHNIIIIFENSYDYIAALFNTQFTNNYSYYIVGVAIGISDYNQKIPMAKKIILSKQIIEDFNNLYLTLNETETLISTESFSLIYETFNKYDFHFQKSVEKINNINIFFKNISNNIKDIRYKLAFKEFNAITNCIQKAANNTSFYIKSRERILKVVLDSFEYKPFKELYIVMPILNEYNLFKYYSPKTKKIINRLKELSKKVKIEIIIILNKCNVKFSIEIEDFFKELSPYINISFVYSEILTNLINSFDFIFTNNKDFILAKLIRSKISAFRFFNDSTTLDDYESYFFKIKKYSIPYKEFIDNKKSICKHIESKMDKKFIGNWNLYLPGSKKFWHDKLVIYQDNSVELYSEGVLTDKGEIIHKTNQSLIILEDIHLHNIITILFDNNSYHISKAFLIKIIGKQYGSNKDIFSIGVCFKEEIDIQEAKDILNYNNKKALYLDDGEISSNLQKYLIEKYGYYEDK